MAAKKEEKRKTYVVGGDAEILAPSGRKRAKDLKAGDEVLTPSGAAAVAGLPLESDLYFQEGKSDKEYHIQLVQDENEDGWAVTAQWGRRGSELHNETKIAGVSYEEAKEEYDKTLKSKLKKGYMPAGL